MLLSDIPTITAHHEPDMVAIHFQGRTITDPQLRDRCNQLSNALLAIAAPGDLIAILGEKQPGICRVLLWRSRRRHGVDAPELPIERARAHLYHRQQRADHTYYRAKVSGRHQPDPAYIPSVRQLILIDGSAEDCIGYDEFIADAPISPPPLRPSEDFVVLVALHQRHDGLAQGSNAVPSQSDLCRAEQYVHLADGRR